MCKHIDDGLPGSPHYSSPPQQLQQSLTHGSEIMEYASKERKMRIVVILILMATLILSNCAPRVIPGPVYLYPKVEPIEIELRSFSFNPNHIAVLTRESLLPFTFRLNNSASIKHNFTLIDDQKNILISVDIMPNESTTVIINPLQSGNYRFYCNRFLHRRAGMKGTLMVAD